LIKDNISSEDKYLQAVTQATLNLMKRCNHNGTVFQKTNSLSLEKKYIFEVLKVLTPKIMTETYFNNLISKFEKSELVLRSNEKRIEIKPANAFCSSDSIFQTYIIEKDSKYTKEDFIKEGIKFLYSAPTLYSNDETFTTTIKHIAKCFQLNPSTISFHTKNMKKIIKYQFISESDYNQIKNDETNSLYAFNVYSNQKSLVPDENGEYKKNSSYYLTPIGSRLLTTTKFKSFGRVDNTQTTINTLHIDSKVKLSNIKNMVSLISKLDSLDKHSTSEEQSSEEITKASFKYDESLQIHFLYTDFETVKSEVRQLCSLLGMVKNLMNFDPHLLNIDMSVEMKRIDKKIRMFCRRAFEFESIDKDVLRRNMKVMRTIMDAGYASIGSKLHIKKHKENIRLALITAKNRHIFYTLDYANKVTNSNYSFLLPNINNQVDVLIPEEDKFKSNKDNFQRCDERSDVTSHDCLRSKQSIVEIPFHYISTKIPNLKNITFKANFINDTYNSYINEYTYNKELLTIPTIS